MEPLYLKEKQIAMQAVIQAIDLARHMQNELNPLDIMNKDDLSPVTIADYSVQALINMHIIENFNNDEIMGEEEGAFLRKSSNQTIQKKVTDQIQKIFINRKENETLNALDRANSQGGANRRFWVIDPIDGTRSFINKEPYVIALALIENGEVVLGVLGCPGFLKEKNGDALFVAVLGQGTEMIECQTLRSIPLKIAPQSRLIYCEPHALSQTHSHEQAFEIAKKLDKDPQFFRLDSQCKYAHVAVGNAAIYFRIPTRNAQAEKIWDHAAGMIIVKEAGGIVTDMWGFPLDFTQGSSLLKNHGIVAANKEIHPKVIEAIKNKQN